MGWKNQYTYENEGEVLKTLFSEQKQFYKKKE